MHHVTDMLQRCDYVRCLMIDFTKAFDLVNHPILLAKLARLDLPERAVNWIISYLTGRSQILKYDGETSSVGSAAEINTSIVQGSGLGPMLYVVMESDLCTLSAMNVLVKYADDTNLLVPSDSDTELIDEFDNVKAWASVNKMIIHLLKTKEIVFRRPNPKLVIYPPPLEQIERVSNAKLLGIILNENLRFDIHVNHILKICSQRFYLLKLLRDQGLPRQHLNTVFYALVMSRLQYALPVWSGYLSIELIGQINSLLKRAYKYGFSSTLHTVENMANVADKALFEKILGERHCLHGLLPMKRAYDRLRPRGHSFELPSCTLELHKRSFIPRCLYKYI